MRNDGPRDRPARGEVCIAAALIESFGMSEITLIVFTTWPDAESARRATRALVEERLAACGNLVPGVESIYRWEGEVQRSAEVLVIFKTTTDRYPRIETRIKALHPYDVPEIIALRIQDGWPAYLRWVEMACVP